MSFEKAEIVSRGVVDGYHTQAAERGTPEFVMTMSSLRSFAANAWRWKAGYQEPETDAMFWGSLVDTLLLTPDLFPSRYSLQPASYTAEVNKCPQCGSVADSASCRKCGGVKRVTEQVVKPWDNSGHCKAWNAEAEAKGLIPVGRDNYAEAEAAVRALKADDYAGEFIAESDTQVWLKGAWRDERSGLLIPIQCLIDFVPRLNSAYWKCLGDLKCPKRAERDSWGKYCRRKAKYHYPAAFYLDFYCAATQEDRTSFVWLLSEAVEPYAVGRRRCPEGLKELGRKFYPSALAYYAWCLSTGKWPGYDDDSLATEGWTEVEEDPWMEFEELSAFMAREQHITANSKTTEAQSDYIVP